MDEDRYWQLVQEARGLDPSPVKVTILEEAVRIADVMQDLDKQVDARCDLMDAAEYSGADAKFFVAYTWCVAQFDRDPSTVSQWNLLWRSKWALANIINFPNVSWQQFEKLAEDIEQRFQFAGYSLRPIHQQRMHAETSRGNFEAAMTHRERWLAAECDAMRDCAACEPNSDLLLQAAMKRDEAAIQAAQPLLDGLHKCRSVPQMTYGHVLLPLHRLGRYEEAEQFHSTGYRQISGNPGLIGTAAKHLFYRVLTGAMGKAIAAFERHIPIILAGGLTAANEFSFYCSSMLMVESLMARSRTGRRKLRLPATVPVESSDGSFELAELQVWLEGRTTELADKFDHRNGTTRFKQRIAESRELLFGN